MTTWQTVPREGTLILPLRGGGSHRDGIPVVNLGAAPDRRGDFPGRRRHRRDHHCYRTFVEAWWPCRLSHPEGGWRGYRGEYWRRWL